MILSPDSIDLRWQDDTGDDDDDDDDDVVVEDVRNRARVIIHP